MAQLDRDGDYIVSKGWVAKLERDRWLSWKGMVIMFFFVSDGRLS